MNFQLVYYNNINIESPIDTSTPLDAAALPRCNLSDRLEDAINKRVYELRSIDAKNKGVSISEV